MPEGLRALENTLPSLPFPRSGSSGPLEEQCPAEGPVETRQHVGVNVGQACWESGGASLRKASDLAVQGHLRNSDETA